MDRVDDLRAVDALQIDAGDPEVRMSQLPLNNDERNALTRHLHRVRMPELVGRKATPHPSRGGCSLELSPHG